MRRLKLERLSNLPKVILPANDGGRLSSCRGYDSGFTHCLLPYVGLGENSGLVIMLLLISINRRFQFLFLSTPQWQPPYQPTFMSELYSFVNCYRRLTPYSRFQQQSMNAFCETQLAISKLWECCVCFYFLCYTLFISIKFIINLCLSMYISSIYLYFIQRCSC